MANTNQMMVINGQQVPKVDVFKNIINQNGIRNQIRSCMGKNAGSFLSSMLDLYSGDGYLQNCDPQLVAMECLKAAALNLPLNRGLGFAYVVPYKNIPTFIIGWKGMVQLAMRTGKYETINADCVYEGEQVKTNRLTGKFELLGERESDEVIGYFGYFKLVNGYEKMLYMTKEEVEAYGRKYSKAYSNGPWRTEFDKMAMKTVLRQLLKFGPMSVEMQKADEYEAMTAQRKAQATVDSQANKTPLDLPPIEMEPVVDIDPNTGEVIGATTNALSGQNVEAQQPVVNGDDMPPMMPGF